MLLSGFSSMAHSTKRKNTMLLDPTNTEPIPVHKPPLAKVLAVFVVLIMLLNVALGVAYLMRQSGGVEVPVPAEVERVVPPAEVTQLAGTVESVGEGSFVLRVSYADDPLITERTVRTAPDTVISRKVLLTEEVFAERMSEFLEAMAAYKKRVEEISPDNTTPFTEVAPEAPLRFTEERLDASALQPGAKVLVTTADDARISEVVTAVTIEVVPESAEPSIP